MIGKTLTKLTVFAATFIAAVILMCQTFGYGGGLRYRGLDIRTLSKGDCITLDWELWPCLGRRFRRVEFRSVPELRAKIYELKSPPPSTLDPPTTGSILLVAEVPVPDETARALDNWVLKMRIGAEPEMTSTNTYVVRFSRRDASATTGRREERLETSACGDKDLNAFNQWLHESIEGERRRRSPPRDATP